MPARRMSRLRSPIVRTIQGACVVAFALGSASCAGGSMNTARPNEMLPSRVGRQAELFDDTIDPAAVGLDIDKGYSPRADKALRERVHASDAVLRVRVATVTSRADSTDAEYLLGLQTIETLAGKHPPPPRFTVHIDKSSDSMGIMKSFESRLVGSPFVAFVREFAHPTDERRVHFHLSPDTKEVKVAVDEAMLFEK